MNKKNTIVDIVNADLCTGCGICVSESPNELKMEWNENGFLIPKNIGAEISEKAIKVCPFNPQPEEIIQDEDKLATIFLNKNSNIDKQIGRYENTYVGFANEYRETSSSGGIATYVFEELLKQKIADHLFIVKEINGTYEYQWFNTIASIKEISKTRYLPVTLENLFKEIDSKEGKVAVSGVACFVKAIRLKQYYNPIYKQKITFIVGIICGGLKSKFFTDYLANKAGIESNYSNQNYRIKDKNSTASDYSFGAFDEHSNLHQLKMKKAGDMWGTGLFKPLACEFCTDVSTELADISLGDAWHHPYVSDGLGTSVIITRSGLANEIILNGIKNNELNVKPISKEEFISSQSGGFNHRHKALKFRFNFHKRKKFLLPKIRQRLFENISWEFKRVQRYRLKTRKTSFELWKRTLNAYEFDKEMDIMRNELLKRTVIYHRINKLKRILNLKK